MSDRYAVIGLGKSGKASAKALLKRGHEVLAFDQRSNTPTDELGIDVHVVPDARDLACAVIDAGVDTIIVSPGIPAHAPIFERAHAAGIPIWGEVELAWRLQEQGPHAGRPWLTVTGTNGKTTTVGMLASILRANGDDVLEVVNIGTPITEAIDSDASVFAVELSSFQLHTSYTISPLASLCLNVDADHLDWHGSEEAYAADKARVYENTQVACIYPANDRVVEEMVENADVVEGARAIGITLGSPSVSQLGVVEGALVDRAYVENRHREAAHLGDLSDLSTVYGASLSPAVVMDALGAAALGRAYGVRPHAVRDGLRVFSPAGHRRAVVGQAADVTWIDDSKATNAHAAKASLYGLPPHSVVWIVGGDAKGQDLTDLIRDVEPVLRGAVIIGEDRSDLLKAFLASAPNVPVVDVDGHEDWMFSVVNEAVALSRPGDFVVLAPACASWDQFDNYGQRGDVFVNAVDRLRDQWSAK